MSLAAVHRLGDLCTGHGCWGGRVNVGASPDVYVNGLGWHRVGDPWATHCCIACHGSVARTGSETVFVNAKAACRVTDDVACGSKMMTGSTTVFCG